jgi:probable HAF family extracellular repeat protein
VLVPQAGRKYAPVRLAGDSGACHYPRHHWWRRNGTLTDLGLSFFPAAINDSGVVVGGPFIDSGGTVQNLNTLIQAGSPYQIQSATGINDTGQIVANATDTATGQTHALLLTPS